MLHCTVKLQSAPRGSHAAAAVGHRIYSFRGFVPRNDRERPDDQTRVCVFNSVSLRWTTLPRVTTAGGERPPEVPCTRLYHTAVLIGDMVYVWGGRNAHGREDRDNVLYAFGVASHRWMDTEVSGTVPEARFGHSACVLQGKDMYIYGGYAKARYTNDMHKLDTTTMGWSLIDFGGTLPPDSFGHSATIMGTKMFVFGGIGRRYDAYNNIRVFDTETNLWLNTPPARPLPKGRRGHSAFVYNGELYIFGGFDRIDIVWNLDDAWKFNPERVSWKEVKLNDPFRVIFGCCCMVGNRVIVFGGLKKSKVVNEDLYILDFSPSLKTLCKLAVIQCSLDKSELPHDIRWELATLTDQKYIK